jgi:hypothetical protein
MEKPVSDFWIVVGVAVGAVVVSYTDFRARLVRIEAKLDHIQDRVYPEEEKERRKQRALEVKAVRNDRWAWLILGLLGVGAWLLSRG